SAFNVSSTLLRTTRSRWFLIRSSSIVMTLFSRLGVVSVMAAPSRLTWLRLPPPSQPDSGPPALPICAKDSVRHQVEEALPRLGREENCKAAGWPRNSHGLLLLELRL